jgi:hypothetical protein
MEYFIINNDTWFKASGVCLLFIMIVWISITTYIEKTYSKDQSIPLAPEAIRPTKGKIVDFLTLFIFIFSGVILFMTPSLLQAINRSGGEHDKLSIIGHRSPEYQFVVDRYITCRGGLIGPSKSQCTNNIIAEAHAQNFDFELKVINVINRLDLNK